MWLTAAIRRVSGGGTNPSLIIKKMEDYSNYLWIILTGFLWPKDDIKRFVTLLTRRKRNETILVVYGIGLKHCTFVSLEALQRKSIFIHAEELG